MYLESSSVACSYIEGWHAIAEANRIFGFDAWNRETVKTNCVWQGSGIGKNVCSYTAQVRVSVRAGDSVIFREGCGSGNGTGTTPGEAHDKAIKEAETDAMKRALSTFGNPFGLALYDKDQKCVRPSPSRRHKAPATWCVYSASGEKICESTDPTKFCSTIKENLEAAAEPDVFMAFWKANQKMVAVLQDCLPDLRTEQGRHYGSILGTLYTDKLQEFAASQLRLRKNLEVSAKQVAEADVADLTPADNKEIEKVVQISGNAIAPYTKRIRDKGHLKFVASQSCLVCGRTPSHAHHVKFAQPRAMARKVSDEWTVPLCYIHHRALHDRGDEKAWWRDQKIDPIDIANQLWASTKSGADDNVCL